jgi:hypothetical protein
LSHQNLENIKTICFLHFFHKLFVIINDLFFQALEKSPEEADVITDEASSTRSSTRINTKTDKAAVILTTAFCEFHRAS